MSFRLNTSSFANCPAKGSNRFVIKCGFTVNATFYCRCLGIYWATAPRRLDFSECLLIFIQLEQRPSQANAGGRKSRTQLQSLAVNLNRLTLRVICLRLLACSFRTLEGELR